MVKKLLLAACCLLALSCKKTDKKEDDSVPSCATVLCLSGTQSFSFRLMDGFSGKDAVSGQQPIIPLSDISLKAGNTNLPLAIQAATANANNGFIYANINPFAPFADASVPLVLTVKADGHTNKVYNLILKTKYDRCCGHFVLGMSVDGGPYIEKVDGVISFDVLH